jgi:hypothetical protein
MAIEDSLWMTLFKYLEAAVRQGITSSSVYLTWDEHDGAQKGYKITG